MAKKHSAFVISLIAVFLGILIGCIVLLVTGINPINMFIALFRSMTGFNILKPENGISFMYPLNWLLDSLPIILTGLSVGFAYRCGMFNIGGEGQFIVGGLAATVVALSVPLPPVIHPIVCILAGALAGAVWAFLPGFLKATRNINEVVICIMLNYIALYFNSWVTRNFLPLDPKTLARTVSFDETCSLGSVSFGTSSQFHWGFLVVILCMFIYWFVIEKTTFGYSLRATGFNKEGARYAGMKTKTNCTLSMMIAGAFVGIAGAIVILGVFKYGRIYSAFDNYGFDGISVALVGATNTIGILLSGLLFGLLKTSGNNLQLLGIPKEIGQLIQACIIMLIAVQYGIRYVLNMLDKRKEKMSDGVTK